MALKHTQEPVAPRIRYYIYGIIRENSGESVRIPSSYELAKLFDTSRRIAQCELERLIAEGVLIGRERIGTFTNPLSSYSFNVARDRMRLIAVTYGGGDHFTYAHEGAFSLAELYRELARRDCYVHDLRLPNKSRESMLRDIVSVKPDGVVWSFPRLGHAPELFQGLAEAGIALASIGYETYGGTPGVVISCRQACEALRKRFAGEKRVNLLLLAEPDNPFAGTIETVFSGAPFVFQDNSRYAYLKTPGILSDILEKNGVPDAIFCHSQLAATLQGELRKRGIDTLRKCRLVALREFSHSDDFQGIILHPPYADAAGCAVDILFDAMERPDVSRRETRECGFTENPPPSP